MYAPDPTQFRYLLSIDIGIHHLALVLLETHLDYEIRDVVWMELVDITHFQHLDAHSASECPLFHSKTITDWLMHVFRLNHELFELVESILIERQPPGGQIAVEQLIFCLYRHKAKLVHPRSVHAFFSWNHVDYDERKRRATKVLEYRLQRNSRDWVWKEYQEYRRQHDLADAYCQAVYFCTQEQAQFRRQKACPVYPELEYFRFKLETT